MGSVMTDDFAVRCTGCSFTWNTQGMVDGLRVLGVCPKCKGELEFRGDGAAPAPEPAVAEVAAAPHLVLGIPRI
jgi:hypothetical protein